MSRIVQARMDPNAEATLKRLRRATGLADSELVRQGLAALEKDIKIAGKAALIRIAGLGRFSSGRKNLGSDKSHLAGFGK